MHRASWIVKDFDMCIRFNSPFNSLGIILGFSFSLTAHITFIVNLIDFTFKIYPKTYHFPNISPANTWSHMSFSLIWTTTAF